MPGCYRHSHGRVPFSHGDANMIRFLALISAVFCLFAGPAPVLAQEPDDFQSARFQTFLASDFMERMRREAIQRSMILHQPDCLESPVFEVVESRPYSPVHMPEGIDLPLEGIWQEQVVTTACEETATENMAHTFTEAGQRTFALSRGTTEAPLETQLTLVPAAIETANTHDYADDCDIIRVSDTSISTRYTRTRWLERWEMGSCGRTIRLDIMITYNSDSTTTYAITLID